MRNNGSVKKERQRDIVPPQTLQEELARQDRIQKRYELERSLLCPLCSVRMGRVYRLIPEDHGPNRLKVCAACAENIDKGVLKHE